MKEYELNRNKEKRSESKRQYCIRSHDKVLETKRRSYYRYRHRISDEKKRLYLRNHASPESYAPRSRVGKSWKSPEQVRAYFDAIAGRLAIGCYDDWYRISRLQILSLEGTLFYFRSLYELVELLFSIWSSCFLMDEMEISLPSLITWAALYNLRILK
jgi:hypothetical protein